MKYRFNIFVDRRGNDKDRITFFEPPSVCNTLPENHVYERYFENIRKCIIPRIGFGDRSKERDEISKAGDNQTITVKSSFVLNILICYLIICYMQRHYQ